MTQYYKPTENVTSKHFQFWSNLQKDHETFIAFCNQVALEAKHCRFNCESPQCTAEETAVRDQIIIGLKDNDIHQEALKQVMGPRIFKERGYENRKCNPQWSRDNLEKWRYLQTGSILI